MSLDKILSDITSTKKPLKDKMKFIKKYRCPKCGHPFSKIMVSKFVTTVMPKCPICNSNEVTLDGKIEKKQKK